MWQASTAMPAAMSYIRPAICGMVLLLPVLVCQSAKATVDEAHQPAEEDDAREVAKKLFRELFDSRQKITQLECRWTVERLVSSRHPELAGSSYNYHAWFDFDLPLFRVERQSNVPQIPSIPPRSRFAYANEQYLIVSGEKLLGHELNGYGPENIHDNGAVSRFILVFQMSTDPRLVGTFPSEFALLKNYSLDSILEVFQSSQSFEVSYEEESGSRVTKVTCHGYHGTRCNITYWFDPRFGGLPTHIASDSNTKDELQIDVQTRWKAFTDQAHDQSTVWLPEECDVRRSEGSRLINHERFTLQDAVVGVPPSLDLCRWETMDIPDGFVVEQRTGNDEVMKQWDAKLGAFGPWRPKPLKIPKADPVTLTEARGGSRLIWIGVNALIVIALFAYVAINRGRKYLARKK